MNSIKQREEEKSTISLVDVHKAFIEWAKEKDIYSGVGEVYFGEDEEEGWKEFKEHIRTR